MDVFICLAIAMAFLVLGRSALKNDASHKTVVIAYVFSIAWVVIAVIAGLLIL